MVDEHDSKMNENEELITELQRKKRKSYKKEVCN